MMHSMTGYGRVEGVIQDSKITVELVSSNRRHLEVKCVLPSGFCALEPLVSRVVRERNSRGSVRITCASAFQESTLPTTSWLTPHIKLWRALEKEYGEVLDPSSYFTHLLQSEKQGVEQVSTPYRQQLLALIDQGIDVWMESKNREGEVLQADFVSRIHTLQGYAAQIKPLLQTQVDSYRRKVQAVLEQVKVSSEEFEKRLAQEVVVYAEKTDVTEELVRLESHLESLEHALCKAERVEGKWVEFMIQEISREVHTLGAKSLLLPLTHLVVACKLEVEKMREQVQNVE